MRDLNHGRALAHVQDKLLIFVSPHVDPEVFAEMQNILFDFAEFLKRLLVILDLIHLVLVYCVDLPFNFEIRPDEHARTIKTRLRWVMVKSSLLRAN